MKMAYPKSRLELLINKGQEDWYNVCELYEVSSFSFRQVRKITFTRIEYLKSELADFI